MSSPDSPRSSARTTVPANGGERPDPIKAMRLRHPWRVTLAVILVAMLAVFIIDASQREAYGWDNFAKYIFDKRISQAAGYTLLLTIYSMVKNDVFGIFFPSLHGPISLWNPVKWLANVAAVALIFGIVVLWKNRKKMEADGKAKSTFYDWFYIWIIAAVGVTGLAAELLRVVSLPSLGYIIYYLHLVSVVMLFLYLPYSKFAHIVYRTTAYAFERYRQSAYVKNPLND